MSAFTFSFFLFSAPSTSVIYTLSLHDALPISDLLDTLGYGGFWKLARRHYREGFLEMYRSLRKRAFVTTLQRLVPEVDRKSTRLNSSHRCISYAVFCLKKKNQ